MKLFVSSLIVCTLLLCAIPVPAQQPTTPADLRKLADDYYNWRNQNFPVNPATRDCTPGQQAHRLRPGITPRPAPAGQGSAGQSAQNADRKLE
jgi:hypothetical protein